MFSKMCCKLLSKIDVPSLCKDINGKVKTRATVERLATVEKLSTLYVVHFICVENKGTFMLNLETQALIKRTDMAQSSTFYCLLHMHKLNTSIPFFDQRTK